MDIVNLENNSNINHPTISNSTESDLKENLNHLIESNTTPVPVASLVTDLNEKAFDTILKNIKEEFYPLVYNDGSDIDDLAETKKKSIIKKRKFIKKKLKRKRQKPLNKRQNNIKDISNEIDTNVYNSNIKKSRNTNLVINNQTRNMSKNLHLSNYQNMNNILSTASNLFKMSHSCSECCVWCKKSFVIYDNPNHIGRIRNIEKQNSFLKIEPTLKIDSCLCDRCWKFLEKTYKFQETEKRKGNNITLNTNDVTESINSVFENDVKKPDVPIIKHTHLKINRKKKQHSETCSVHNCNGKPIHIIPKDECIQIKKIFSKFNISRIILIEKINTKLNQLVVPYLYLCEEHLLLVNIITTCQLCCNRLNHNLNPDIWNMYYKWNHILKSNKIPLSLLPGMFVCVTCQSYISEKDLSSLNLEFIRKNIEKRKDICIKVFNPANINQGRSVISSEIIAKMFKFNNSPKLKKVKFTEPLITSTYYVECYIGKYNSNEDLNLFSNQEKEYNENINVLNLKTSNVENLSFDPVEVNNVNEYSCNPKKEHYDKESTDSVNSVLDCELLDIKEEHIQTTMTKKYVDSSSSYINQNPRPNIRVIKMMKLLQNNNIKAEDKVSILPEHDNKEQLSTIFTENFKNCDLNDRFNNSDNIKFKFTQSCVAARMDVEKNLLPLHVCNLLDNNENKMSEDVVVDENNPIITDAFLHKEVSNDGNKTSDHTIKKDNSIENDNYDLVITNVYSQQNIDNINKDNSEMKSSKNNQITNKKDVSVVETEYLNESNQCFHSPILVNSPTTDPIEIRKKLRNVVCQRILNGNVKRQRLNETFKINKIALYGADNNENNSSYKNNFTESNINQNYNSTDIQELSSGEDEVINEPMIRIESTYSLDPNFLRPLRIHRTLQKVSDFYNTEMLYKKKIRSPVNKNKYYAYNDKILKKFSQEYQTYNNIKYQSKMNRKKFIPIHKTNIKASKTKNPKLLNLTNDEVMNVTDNIRDPSDKNNDEEEIIFHLTNANNKIYEELFDKFNGDESSMFMYLMENQRMLFNGELVLSNNANKGASNYIKRHLDELHNWYGNPKNTDAHQSYLQHALTLSDHLSTDRESLETNDIITISSPSSVNSNDSISPIKSIPLDQALHVDLDTTSSSTSDIIEIDDNSCTSSPKSDYSDDQSSIMTNDLISLDEIAHIQNDNTIATSTFETDDIISISSPSCIHSEDQMSTMKNDAIPFNQVTLVQDDMTTTTTFSTSKPITSSRIFNLTKETTDKPKYNFQLPVAIRSTSVNLPKPVQPSFQIPTAVRSRGMPFMQTNKLFLQPNLNTNVRNMLNNNHDCITDSLSQERNINK